MVSEAPNEIGGVAQAGLGGGFGIGQGRAAGGAAFVSVTTGRTLRWSAMMPIGKTRMATFGLLGVMFTVPLFTALEQVRDPVTGLPTRATLERERPARRRVRYASSRSSSGASSTVIRLSRSACPVAGAANRARQRRGRGGAAGRSVYVRGGHDGGACSGSPKPVSCVRCKDVAPSLPAMSRTSASVTPLSGSA